MNTKTLISYITYKLDESPHPERCKICRKLYGWKDNPNIVNTLITEKDSWVEFNTSDYVLYKSRPLLIS